MPRVIAVKLSHTPEELRRLAARTKDANQSRRLLSIAAVLEGMSRADAARIGGMDRQTVKRHSKLTPYRLPTLTPVEAG